MVKVACQRKYKEYLYQLRRLKAETFYDYPIGRAFYGAPKNQGDQEKPKGSESIDIHQLVPYFYPDINKIACEKQPNSTKKPNYLLEPQLPVQPVYHYKSNACQHGDDEKKIFVPKPLFNNQKVGTCDKAYYQKSGTQYIEIMGFSIKKQQTESQDVGKQHQAYRPFVADNQHSISLLYFST